MKKLMHSALNVLTALSLLAFLATAALWASTFFVQMSLHRDAVPEADTWPPLFMSRSYMTGRVMYVRWEPQAGPDPGVAIVGKTLTEEKEREAYLQASPGYDVDTDWSCPGLWVGLVDGPDGHVRAWNVMVRYWLVLCLTGALPAIAGVRRFAKIRESLANRRARHHAAAGTCARCGYDLRATPARCPECGTSAVKAPE